MNNITKLNVWFLALLFQALVGSAEASSQLNFLKDIHVEKDAETLAFRLDFNSLLKKKPNPVFYKKSVQLDFADAFIDPAKRTIATHDPLISQILVAQQDPKTLRVRLIIGETKREIKDGFHLEKKGNSLVIRIDKHPKDVLDKFIANVKQAKENNSAAKQYVTTIPAAKPLPKPTLIPVPVEEASSAPTETINKAPVQETKTEIPAKVESAISAETSVAETKVADKDIVSGPDKTPGFLKYTPPVVSEPPSLLASGWKMFYTLALVLALMFFIFYVFKKLVLKNSVLGGNDRLVKVLSTSFLGPKKMIALVDVAGEILVLGISDGNISLLTQVHDDDRIERIKSSSKNSSVLAKLWNMEEPKNTEQVTIAPAQDPVPNVKKGNPFTKYIKQFSSQAESVQVSPAATVADLIRKSREKVKAV